MRYTRKPQSVEAMQIGDTIESRNSVAKWCGGAVNHRIFGIRINGEYATTGDYVVKDDVGFYIMAKLDFEKNYNKV